jgi:hypothetical protein
MNRDLDVENGVIIFETWLGLIESFLFLIDRIENWIIF